jgi:hypothetical protein
MRAAKIIAYVLAAILLFFGVIFILGSFGAQGNPNWIWIGLICVAIALVLIFWAARQHAPAQTNVTLNVDLPGDVNVDALTCLHCGAPLTAENIKMVAGAPVVTCPYCGSTYQLTEEPKW